MWERPHDFTIKIQITTFKRQKVTYFVSFKDKREKSTYIWKITLHRSETKEMFKLTNRSRTRNIKDWYLCHKSLFPTRIIRVNQVTNIHYSRYYHPAKNICRRFADIRFKQIKSPHTRTFSNKKKKHLSYNWTITQRISNNVVTSRVEENTCILSPPPLKTSSTQNSTTQQIVS